MAEQTENVVLEILRPIRASQERMELDVADLKVRASSIEPHIGQLAVALGGVNQRLDRLDERVTRIERRLDLVDAS